MTIPLALLLIVILLIYDAMFLKMLVNRKKKVIFAIYIENGKLTSTEGSIPADFLSLCTELCQRYKPGKLKITAILIPKKVVNKNYQQPLSNLNFSGTLDDVLKAKLINEYELYRYTTPNTN